MALAVEPKVAAAAFQQAICLSGAESEAAHAFTTRACGAGPLNGKPATTRSQSTHIAMVPRVTSRTLLDTQASRRSGRVKRKPAPGTGDAYRRIPETCSPGKGIPLIMRESCPSAEFAARL